MPLPPRRLRASRRSFLGLGAALVAGGALAGCSTPDLSEADLPLPASIGYDGPALTLRFWNGLTGGDGAIMRQLLLDFHAEHPAITIEMFAMPWPSFYQKFPAAVVSGLAPDLGLMQSFHVATNAVRGVIVPLDEVADRLALSESDFAATVWRSGVVGGKRYSIPLDVWPDSLFYNRRVLADAGLDPDDPPRDRVAYENTLETLATAGIAGHWLPAVDPQGVGRGFDSLQWQMGGELYDAEGSTALFNGEAGIEALQWQRSLIDQGWSKRDVNGADANTAFKNDLNAFLWGGPGALINDLGAVEDLDWGVVPLPQIGTQKASFSGSHQFIVMRQREYEENRLAAILTFLSWIGENSIGWAGAGPIPARLDVVSSPEFSELTAQSSIAQALPDVRFYPLVPGIFDVQSTILYPAISDVLLGRAEPAVALDAAAERAQFLLTENRQKYGEAMS
ncbi:MAG: ABC transporter substrate-binding protein [Nocardioidaceae bacterium]